MYLFRSVTPEAREISFKVYDEDSNKKGIKNVSNKFIALFVNFIEIQRSRKKIFEQPLYIKGNINIF